MKKALIDQIMLGLFLFVSLIVFGATVSDEFAARNKVLTLDKLVQRTTTALAKHYMYNENMEDAQNIGNSILNETTLGKEIVDNNLITYTWSDIDADGDPDTITSTIAGYNQDNFWYRFLNQDNFALPTVSASAFVTKDESDITSIHIRYGGSFAGYFNMIGTYELDNNGCVQNPSILLAKKTDYEVGDELGTYTNLDTRFFIIANGYNLYGKTSTENSDIKINGCLDDNTAPSVEIDGTTDAAPIYFQDTELNSDNGYDHMHEVGKTYFDDYNTFIKEPITYCSRYRSNGSCRRWSQRGATWEDWEVFAAENSIDFGNDPNDEYVITMEDLPNGGDKDFNDINLDTTKVRTPRTPSSEVLEGGVDVSP